MVKKIDKCTKCYGFGFWPYGILLPIGPIDSSNIGRNITIKCPWCSSGSVDRGDRYKTLLDMKNSELK